MATAPLFLGLLFLSLLGILAGCEGCGNDGAGASGRATGTGGASATTGTEAPETGEAAPAPGPPPVLGLRVEEGFEGSATLVIENRGAETTSLSSALVLEREEEGSFAPVPGVTGLRLRYDCEEAPPECLPLLPGAALHPPPWTGDLGDAQCDCERCTDAPAGTYRFVVTTCDGAHRVTSPAFTR